MEALSQMWVAMLSWFTPTVLFVLLNVVIGTIVVTSGMRQSNNTNKELRRNPSLLYRLSSFSFSRGKVEDVVEFNHEEDQKMLENVVLEKEKGSINVEGNSHKQEYSTVLFGNAGMERQIRDNVVAEAVTTRVKMSEKRNSKVEVKTGGSSQKTQKKEMSNGLGRSKSDTPPTADLRPPPLPQKLKKSGTFESTFSHFDSQALAVLEVTPEVNKVDSDDNGPEDTEEVNAKADDFINKFKQQLKLQRLESIMRYKEMINRGK